MNTETNQAAIFYSEIENDTEVLEKNVSDYPSSSLTRFLLLYHYKKNNDPRFEEFAQQTAVYLYNPLWIQLHLSNADENGNIYSNGALYANPGNEPAASIENQDISNGANSEQKEPDLPVNEPIYDILNLGTINLEGASTPLATGKPDSQIEKTVTLGTSLDESHHKELSEFQEEPKENNLDNHESEDIRKKPVQFFNQELPTIVNEQISETLTLGVDLNEQKIGEVLDGHKDGKSSSEEGNILANSNTPSDNTDDHLTEKPNVEKLNNIQENDQQGEKSSQINSIKENTETVDDGNNDSEIEFEPLHTVDYFASQGIKIPEEALENDTLGKQVKSFTAWLKSMKKLHPGQLPEQNEVIERIIQASSEVSNQNAHVLTEAMAEVLVKQDKKGKAIEMYEKLSLLNPSKSAYFAAKIEILKII